MDSLRQTTQQSDPSYLVVIPITDDIEYLENEWKRYQELPIELMQDSDDACIRQHGCTNQDLYMRLKHELEQKDDDTYDNSNVTIGADTPNTIISEGFQLPLGMDNDNFIVDDTLKIPSDDLIEKIKYAQSLESDTMVIIYPYTNTYPYSLDDLEAMFTRYNMMSWDLQQMSDQESMKLFNYDVRNMYFKNKNKLLSMMNSEPIVERATIENRYMESVSSICENSNNLTVLLKKKLDLINLKQNGNLLESTFAEDSLKDIDIALDTCKDISDAVPEFTPFFTPLEYDDVISSDLSEEEKENYKKIRSAISDGYKNFDSKWYKEQLVKVQNSNESYTIKERAFLNLGWNPNLEIREDFVYQPFKFARQRQINYLKEFHKINLVDVTREAVITEGKMSDLSITLVPVFMVVGLDVCYLSTDPELRFLFDDTKETISFSLIMKDTDLDVYCLFVDKSTFEELNKHIKDARYNTELFNALRSNISDRKRMCSVFIDVISAMTGMERNNDPKVYHIFHGQKMYFTADKIEPIIKGILSDSVGFVMRKYTVKDAVNKVFKEPSVETYKTIKCNESETEANDILEELNFLYHADSVLVEAKSAPIRISDKGVTIDLPTQIEEEYQTLHKSLLLYEKEGNYEEMKPAVAHLWYLNLLCERRINKYKGNDKKAQQLKVNRDTRARILNDFKKYLKLIIEHDKSFDFASYFKKSPYNDRSIFINKDTLRYSAKAMQAIVKAVLKSIK